MLSLDGSHGVVLAADLNVTSATVALCDLAGRPLAEAVHELRLTDGPEPVLAWVERRWSWTTIAATFARLLQA